jgi:8-oxo-dGTP pyrophosphatase MutT (NUDIX family)
MLKSNTEEWVDAIDENNAVIGKVLRSEAYTKLISHRIVHVLVLRGDRALITRRANSVRYLPGAYCTSAGGHVEAGEDVALAAEREMHEEIGLRGPVSKLGEFFFTHEFKVHVTVFVKEFVEGMDQIKLSPREVRSAEFVTVETALALCAENAHPQLRPCLELLQKTLLGATS